MTKSHKISREKAQLRRGALIKLQDGDYLLKEYLANSQVLLKKIDDNKSRVADIKEVLDSISLSEAHQNLLPDDILSIPKQDLAKAKQRLEILKPLLSLSETVSLRDIKNQADKVDVHYTTIYRWLKNYSATHSLVSLVPQKRGWRRRDSRVPESVDKIIEHGIDTYYLTKDRFPQQFVYLRIREACAKAGVTPPSRSTVFRRIAMVSEEKRLRARGHLDTANNRFAARAGKFPNVDAILSVVQIDHTPLDIMIVDDEHRESIKRVWLTMAIDLYSRMVTGFYLSLDAPSTTSVAMCLSHSIAPKHHWLKHLGIDLDWSVWGIPRKVHVDNGADFTSDALRIGCIENGIDLEFRPVAKPQYGGHIERLLGTFQNKLKALDGKTFNSAKVRASYDSEKHAIFDFDALELWLTNAIIEYHHTKHESIGVPPATKWLMSVEGELEELPSGWPDVPVDVLSIEISFLPYQRRNIRSQGIVWDGIYYFSDSIRHLIGQTDRETRKPRKFIVRRDPRNIRHVWVYDDGMKCYHKVSLADPTLHFTSVWELNEAKSYLKERGESEYNQDMLSRAIENMNAIEDQARNATKEARRKAQKKKNHKNKVSPASHFEKVNEDKPTSTPPSESPEFDDWGDDDDVVIFDIE
ncbi:DDE-type integrase/transposase/recombinase [Pseudidiomarina sp. 1APP75-27a]|uniref:Mu transposase C-terminal domain-containing protein n=1 Tax=Pseudidiomarina terrestris TaxID=2820060 RepID=UPI002B05E2B5|nr:Mu transposase C-terminal domain-containing protein [Pseudidiomarina sp. 1APP75-27a]MEA3588403.1 DDE-type integrase/transposase/recombinase [Pseudidiomarina sp. 1APP75-27a]